MLTAQPWLVPDIVYASYTMALMAPMFVPGPCCDETQCGECQQTAPHLTSQLSRKVGIVIVSKLLGKLRPVAGTLLTLSEPARDLKDSSPGHQADFLRGLCAVSLPHIAFPLVVPYPWRLPGCPEVIAIH